MNWQIKTHTSGGGKDEGKEVVWHNILPGKITAAPLTAANRESV